MVGLTSASQLRIETPIQQKSSGIAVLLGLIIPGAGQMYADRVLRGMILLIVTLLATSIGIGFILWIYGMIDAYCLARKWNRKLDRAPYTRPW